MPVKKQFKTTALLLILILCCLAGVYYARTRVWAAGNIDVPFSPVSQGLEEAITRFETSGVRNKADLLTAAQSNKSEKAELVFWGLGDETLTGEILSILESNGIGSAFYITEANASANSASLSLIANSNYPVGIAYNGSASIAGKTAAKRAISDFIRTSASIQLLTGLQPSTVLALDKPDEDLLAAAYATSLQTVLVPTRTVMLASVTSLPGAAELLGELPRGSILCLRLDGMTRSGVDYLRELIVSLVQTDFSRNAKALLTSPYQPTLEISNVYTTERAVAFTFSGLGNEEELTNVLKTLESLKAVSTFFVSEKDLAQFPSQVRLILDKGHALGIAAQSAGAVSAEALLMELMQVEETLRSGFAYTKPLPVRPAFGGYTNALRNACGAGGYTLLSAMGSAAKFEDARATDPAAVLAKQFPERFGALQRGGIIHFQMKQYQYSNSMLSELARLLATQRNIYGIKPVMDIINNREYTYTYPLKKESILPEVRDAIHPGQLTGDPVAAIKSRYIGIFWVDSTNMLPGFTWQEVNKLDKKGLIPNSQNMVFLSFDDWGTDKTINALLDVLRKNNAKATFFVRTNYVASNPNLLRAIALEGHSIASHTHTHFPLSNDVNGKGTKFADLTTAQVAALTQDLVTSYQILQSIVGDISINGRPALTRLFRPPTLAVGKSGLQTVLDVGFIYSVSGSHTSEDYKAIDAKKLADTLRRNTKSGSVLIMHMSDVSVHTPQALELYFAEMAKGKITYRFASLDEALR